MNTQTLLSFEKPVIPRELKHNTQTPDAIIHMLKVKG